MQKKGILIGLIFIAIGILALLNNLGIISHVDHLPIGAALLVISFLFFRIYNGDRQKWWALLPALICLFLGVVMVLQIFWNITDELIGAGILWCCAAAFGSVYFKNNRHWWAVLPAGIFFTLGTVVLIEGFDLLDDELVTVVFLLGSGLTFVFLWSQKSESNRTGWAIIPAAVIFVLALLIYVENVRWLNWEIVLPVLLIGFGIYLVMRTSRDRSKETTGPPVEKVK